MKSYSFDRIRYLALTIGIFLVFLGTYWVARTAFAQGPEPEGVTALLVIDDSRSMGLTDPNLRRGLGGRLLIERLFPEDQIGMVFFSSRAKVVRPVSPIDNDQNRDHLKSSFALLQSSGSTDMLDALRMAFTQLEQDTSNNPKLVIFLTDGQLLSDQGESLEYQAAMTSLLRSYRANKWPVFPISFGHDVDTQFLQSIAEVTGGATCDAPTDTELVACFQTALDTFKETEKVLEVLPSCLKAAETTEYSVYVDPYARQLSMVFQGEDASPAVSVTDPQGTPIESHREEGNFLFYNFSNPSTGTWLIRLAGPGCFGETSAYIHSDVAIDLKSPSVVHAAHQPMDIRALIQGRRPDGDGSWDTLSGDLALSVVSPEGLPKEVTMVGARSDSTGRYADTSVVGDYRLGFHATVEFQDPYSGQLKKRTYVRQKRVELVAAPVLDVALDGGPTYQVLPGDSFQILGHVSPTDIVGLPSLKATIGGSDADLDFAPDGTFSVKVTPSQAGEQDLDVSFETALVGRYGEVHYRASKSVHISTEFQPLTLQLSLEDSRTNLISGKPVSLKGQVLSGETPISVDQDTLTVQLVTPRQDTVLVKMAAVEGSEEFHGSFVPEESGQYALSGIDTPLTRNGVPLTLKTDQALDLRLRPVLEVDVNTLALGQVYPGALVTRQLRVSNHSDLPISLVARTESKDFSFNVSPVLVPANSEMQPVEAQFQLNNQLAAGGGGAPADVSLEASPQSGVGAGVAIPVTYEVGDFFVEAKEENYDLGYVRGGNHQVLVQLDLGFNAPTSVRLVAEAADGSGTTTSELVLPEGQGTDTLTLTLPLLDGQEPGAYQGSIQLITDPPIPVRPMSEVGFSYRVPSPLQSWVLDRGWWTLAAGGGAAAVLLLAWGGIIAQRVTVQGRLFIYDRLGLTRARREDLRKFSRPEVTIGSRADISLSDPSGVIEKEHVLVAASRETPYPRVYPVDMSRLVGPFGEQVGAEGVPLGQGDTFSIGHYNLEWSPASSAFWVRQVLANPRWKIGVVLATGAIGIAAVAFYLVLL